ncbi:MULTISPECIES: lichenicidin alpha family lanthipeptide [Bacillus cereus group]|nr:MULTISPECIES: lichenicidin alpha family lanthipeptide [Bacillus cereus group]HDR7226113.1 lichenicidin alpha family lanthipeptide [Bacillus toyonensis]HDR7839217.1 lichenicidin alpha family lanthipeptide [Bacillus toyonensis]
MFKLKKENISELAKESYLNQLDKSDKRLENSFGADCTWWDLSCHLGNDGSTCTLSVECRPACW